MQVQAEKIQIEWFPLADMARFHFETHEQALSFLTQLYSATISLHSKEGPADQPDIYSAPNTQFYYATKYHPAIYLIEGVSEFIYKKKSSFNLEITAIGKSQNVDMPTIIRSILEHGPEITAEQIRFKNPLQQLNNIIDLITDRHMNPKVKLHLIRLNELQYWVAEEALNRINLAIAQSSSYQVSWMPLTQYARFDFSTHDQLKLFLERFDKAVQLYLANGNLSSGNKNYKPNNEMSNWIYIENRDQILSENLTSMKMVVTIEGDVMRLNIMHIIDTILSSGPLPEPEQFKFAWLPHEVPTEEDIRTKQYESLQHIRDLAIVSFLQNAGMVNLLFEDFSLLSHFLTSQQCTEWNDNLAKLMKTHSELKYLARWAIPVKDERLGWAADAFSPTESAHKQWPNREESVPVETLVAESPAPAPAPTAAIAESTELPVTTDAQSLSIEDIQKRMLTKTFPELLIAFNNCQDAEALLELEASIAEFNNDYCQHLVLKLSPPQFK